MLGLLSLRFIELATLFFAGASALVGLFIAFLAARALRRHRSNQMIGRATWRERVYISAGAVS